MLHVNILNVNILSIFTTCNLNNIIDLESVFQSLQLDSNGILEVTYLGKMKSLFHDEKTLQSFHTSLKFPTLMQCFRHSLSLLIVDILYIILFFTFYVQFICWN